VPRGNKEQQPAGDRGRELRSQRNAKEKMLGKALLLGRCRKGYQAIKDGENITMHYQL
jgi:hypothetical protein